jgi:hypothetical protein
LYRSPDCSELHTAVAQVFNERGDGVVVRGGAAKISRADRQPHLNQHDAHQLLADALAEYRRAHGHLPARVVLHKTSSFSDEETNGFRSAAEDKEIDFVELIWVQPCRWPCVGAGPLSSRSQAISVRSLDVHHLMVASQVGNQTRGRVVRILGPALHRG